MELTAAELTVLGLIVECPRHGYDMESIIEERGVRRWTDIAFSSIYYLLSKLEQRGLIAADTAQPGAKSRRVFRATEAGRAEAAAGARSLIADHRPVPQPFLVGLANQALLGEREYDQALRTRLAHVLARIDAVVSAEHAQAPLPRPARDVFTYSLGLLEAEKSWLATRVGTTDE